MKMSSHVSNRHSHFAMMYYLKLYYDVIEVMLLIDDVTYVPIALCYLVL